MKRISKYLLLLLAFASFNSCTKDDTTPVVKKFDAFLSEDANLSVFKSMVDKAQLDDFKNGPGPFTWLAPTNAGLARIGITQDTVNKLTAGQCNYIIMYHLINARVESKDMITRNSIPRSTQLGSTSTGLAYIGMKGTENFINGSKIVSIDNQVSNGVVHVLDRGNIPPLFTGTIQAMLMRTGQHTLFMQAMSRAGLLTQLNSTSIFTVLAPTDAAMTAAGLDAATITSMSIATLTNTLRLHYFNNSRFFSNDFVNGKTNQTALAGKQLTVSNNGAALKGPGNTTDVTFLAQDFLGTNGVLHILNGVLRP
jgi:uncharacterized surface protein with fasciclin (FAS1) repeats